MLPANSQHSETEAEVVVAGNLVKTKINFSRHARARMLQINKHIYYNTQINTFQYITYGFTDFCCRITIDTIRIKKKHITV